jgi:Spy/CpxP family protein refolding chaperone
MYGRLMMRARHVSRKNAQSTFKDWMNYMKPRALIVLAFGTLLAVSAWSQTPGWMMNGNGMGPGMMGGYGSGMMGGGYGMGPGMMGGYGMGPGMMWGYGGNPWSYGNAIPDLTNAQRDKIAAIEKGFRQKQWQVMGKMAELGYQSNGYTRDGKFDEQAARKAYDARASLRKQMFENHLDERKQIDSVLTPQQREHLQQGWSGK